MDRRGFLAGALAFGIAGPALAAPTDAISRYETLLQSVRARAGGGRFLTGLETALTRAHSSIRRDQGLSGLQPHAGLAMTARAHASDLAMRGFMDHISPEGFGPSERVGLLARTFLGLPGENIVDTQGRNFEPEPEVLMTSWMESPGHRDNILRPDYTHVGLGAVQRGSRTVAVAVFGQLFAELPDPIPLAPSAAELAPALAAASPTVDSFDLSPLGDEHRQGAFSLVSLPHVAPGAYQLRPRLARSARSWTIVYGPIVALKG